MTMQPCPRELLCRAADHLENRAAAATPGPWSWCNQGQVYPVGEQLGRHPDGRVKALAIPRKIEDSQWISTVHPGIAKPLAAWLRWESTHDDIDDIGLWTIGLARAILKEEESV